MKKFYFVVAAILSVTIPGKILCQCTISMSGSISNVTCSGNADGAIDVSVSGEQGNVTYAWDDGATTEDRTGLDTGMYILTATDDSGCQVIDSFVITQPDSLQLTSIVSNESIPGGSDGAIDISVSGGTPSYTFSWSNGETTEDVTNLTAATYSVTVQDANGCLLNAAFDVLAADCQIQVLPDTPSICSGGSGVQLIATAFGAAGFTWSPATGLSATSGAVVIATPTTTQTYTVTATNLNNCSDTIQVVVNPSPLMNSVSNVTYCNGDMINTIDFTSTPQGQEFHWSGTTNVGFGTSGEGDILSTTVVNNGTKNIKDTINVFAVANGCEGFSTKFIITVKPTPKVDDVSDYIFCNGESMSVIQFTSVVSNAEFFWKTTMNTDIGFGTDTLQGSSINYIATNAGNIPKIARVRVWCIANGCQGPAISFYITVNPSPVITQVSDTTFCNGDNVTGIDFNSTISGTEFHWTCSSNIGFGLSGIGNIPPFAATNTDTFTSVDSIIVYGVRNGCIGAIDTFQISITPTPVLTNQKKDTTICSQLPFNYVATTYAGIQIEWERPAVSGISNPAASGSTLDNTISILETLIDTGQIPVIVNYNFVLTPADNSCVGHDTVRVTVNPTPILNSSPSMEVCDMVPFTYHAISNVPGTTYSWSRESVPGINDGDTITGQGSLISDSLHNTTFTDILVHYFIDLDANSCPTVTDTLSVLVRATPQLSPLVMKDTSICNGIIFFDTLRSETDSVVFGWYRPPIAGILPDYATGTDSLINDTLVNSTHDPVTVFYIISLSNSGCLHFDLISLTVNPTMQLSSTHTNNTCDSVLFIYQATSLTDSADYSWERKPIAGINDSVSASGNDSLIQEILDNQTLDPIVVHYHFHLTIDSCTSEDSIAVTVNPTPHVDPIADIVVCDGGPVDTINFSGDVINATYSWTCSENVGFGTSGTGNIDSFTATNDTAQVKVAIVTVHAEVNGCVGPSKTFTITVNPNPVLNSDTTRGICDSVPFVYNAESSTPGVAFSWVRLLNNKISNPPDTIPGSLINETLNNTSSTDTAIVTYVFTLTIGPCSNVQLVHITVNPTPVLDSSLTYTICSGETFSFTSSSNADVDSFSWSRAAVPGISNPDTSATNSAVIQEVLVDTTDLPVVVTYADTLHLDSCINVQYLQVTVNPTPHVDPIADKVYCNGDSVPSIHFSSPTPYSTFDWTSSQDVGFGTSGSDSIIHFHATGLPDTLIADTVIVTDIAQGCVSAPDTFTITVNPVPRMASVDTAICSGATLDFHVTDQVSDTLTVLYSWTTSAVPFVTGNTSKTIPDANNTIPDLLVSTVTNDTAQVYYDVTLIYENAGKTCSSDSTLTVDVLPSPPKPTFSYVQQGDTICSCSVNLNFNVDSNTNAVTYLWSSPNDSVKIRNLTNPNTVISFGCDTVTETDTIIITATNDPQLGSCGESAFMTVIVSPNVNSIQPRKIILKQQPGNLLVYPDNTMSPDIGYRWGYDLKIDTNPIKLGPPHFIPDQNYQVFVPDKVYLDTTQTKLDTNKYCFWVLLTRGACKSKVYYNGPYAEQRLAESLPAFSGLTIYPNPTSGNFSINLTGNIYGSIVVKMYNTLGELLYQSSFTKIKFESQLVVHDLHFPEGIYYVELESKSHQRFTSKIMINH